MQVRPRLGKHQSATTPACDRDSHARSENPQIHHPFLSLYIAMAHAGLATALLVLTDFLRPLQWVLLCSVPLCKTQHALVAFWEPSLRVGLQRRTARAAARRRARRAPAPSAPGLAGVLAPPPLARLLLLLSCPL